MKIPEIKRKIEILRKQYSDSDSMELLGDAENEVEEMEEVKDFLDHKVFKKLVAEAEKKANVITALLANDRELDNDKRHKLFIERDVWRWIVMRFGIKSYDEALKALDEALNTKIKSK